MKTKTKLIGFAALLLAGIIFTGCVNTRTITTRDTVIPGLNGALITNSVTTTNMVRTVDPVRTSQAIRAMVPPLVRLAVTLNTNVTAWVVDAKVGICMLSESTNVAPADLKIILAQTGLAHVQTPEVEAAVEAIYGIYSAYWGDAINKQLSGNERLAAMVPVLQSICEALGAGLTTQ